MRYFEELAPTDPENIDRSEIVEMGVKRFALWCVWMLIIAATGILVFFLIEKFWQGVLPVILAIIVCTVLWPPTAWLRSRGLPPALASLIAILLGFGLIGGSIWAIAPSVIAQSQVLYFQAIEGIQRAQLWLQGPPLNVDSSDMNNQINGMIFWIQNSASSIAGEIFSGIGMATSVAVTLGVVLVLTFFFLKDGDKFLPWVRSVTGQRNGWHMTELLTRCWNTLGGFIRAQAIVSLCDAFFIGLGLVLLEVPLALALALLTFFAGFIPIVGAFVAGTLAVLVALVSLGLTKALIVLALILIVQQIEGNVLSPILQSRAMKLHPVVILFSVTVGGALFGIVGAFLAVPVAAMIAVIFRYLQDMTALQTGEKTASEIQFATIAGSITGQYGEETSRRLRAERKNLGERGADMLGRFHFPMDRATAFFTRSSHENAAAPATGSQPPPGTPNHPVDPQTGGAFHPAASDSSVTDPGVTDPSDSDRENPAPPSP
ncbi:MAG: AI-2E family transporter [Corynebacterium sp.]|nr:AI-2E family transporter [Corynebacterium sp.]